MRARDAAAPGTAPSPIPTPPAASVVYEEAIGPENSRLAFPFDHQRDPIVAVHPADPETMVVAYVTLTPGLAEACGVNAAAIGLRRTVDGGRTWRDTAARYWKARGLCTSFHPAIAWGPGPRAGGYRLYFAGTGGPCGPEGVCVLISYSDDAEHPPRLRPRHHRGQ